MRSADYILAAALTFGLVGSAAAQAVPAAPSTATTQAITYGQTVSHWLASGFAGSGFDSKGDNPRVDTNSAGAAFGGQVGYLWRGVVGPEVLVEWAPSFDLTSALIDNAHVFSYMANAIGALPLGADGQIQPYVSGGFGRVQLVADIPRPDGASDHSSNGQRGTNLGGGVMAFANNSFGVRGDMRYYHASTANDLTGSAGDQFIEGLTSGLHYWRATGGLSFRW
jgi:hypothetical protein